MRNLNVLMSFTKKIMLNKIIMNVPLVGDLILIMERAFIVELHAIKGIN